MSISVTHLTVPKTGEEQSPSVPFTQQFFEQVPNRTSTTVTHLTVLGTGVEQNVHQSVINEVPQLGNAWKGYGF